VSGSMGSGSMGGGKGSEREPAARMMSKILSEDERRRILHERARLLALKEVVSTAVQGETLYVFEFFLAGEKYAFDTKFVQEVLPGKNVASLTCTPRFITGVMNVRGEIVTVLDTKMLFGLESQGMAPDTKIIIINNGSANMGFLVDQVIGISELSRHDLQPPLPTIGAQQTRYIQGITAEPLILIDVDALTNDPGIVVDEEVE
jgi:purine-binding chemotaxis protein CheW